MAYQFQPAETADSQALLELMEGQPAEGNIQLLYTRRPDPVASFLADGEETSLGLVRDSRGEPVLMEASLFRPLYIGGEARKAGYLCGLRKRQDVFFKGNPLKLLFEYEGGKSDYCFCSVLDDNKDVMGLLAKKRPYMPELVELCSYRTYMIKPAQLLKLGKVQLAGWAQTTSGQKGEVAQETGAALKPAGSTSSGMPPHKRLSAGKPGAEDLPELYGFLADYGKEHDFFPAVTDLEKQFPELKLSDCVVVRRDGRIVGFGALWDQRGYKQYIVKRYKGAMKLARLLSPAVTLAGYVPIPQEGEVLPLATLSLLAVQDHDREIYECLLAALAEEAQRRELPILVVGLPEDNWQREHIDKVKSLHFDSRLYSMEWPGKEGIIAARTAGERQLQVECGLL